MKPRKPIPRKRSTPRVIHSERTGSHKRVRLYGAAKSARRAEIFERAGGRCEEVKMLSDMPGINVRFYRCNNPASEWSHAKHGARKCDCYSPTAEGACSIASCHNCHERRHRPKVVPKKPLAEAK